MVVFRGIDLYKNLSSKEASIYCFFGVEQVHNCLFGDLCIFFFLLTSSLVHLASRSFPLFQSAIQSLFHVFQSFKSTSYAFTRLATHHTFQIAGKFLKNSLITSRKTAVLPTSSSLISTQNTRCFLGIIFNTFVDSWLISTIIIYMDRWEILTVNLMV